MLTSENLYYVWLYSSYDMSTNFKVVPKFMFYLGIVVRFILYYIITFDGHDS